MSQEEAVKHWIDSSKEDLETAEALFKSEKFVYCLFFCHLAVEKLIKAIVIKKTDGTPPISHNLAQIFRLTGLPISETLKKDLDEMTTFNIEARYDIYKLRLHKKSEHYLHKKFL